MTVPFDTRSDYLSSVNRLTEAADAYYSGRGLLMDDDSYDSELARLAETESAHPEWVVSHGLVTAVAAGTQQGDVSHSEPMLSLDNVFDSDGLAAWHSRLCSIAGCEPDLVVEPKLDGLAVSARFEAGRLVRVVTRGDGSAGEDVTGRLDTVTGLPEDVDVQDGFEVRGEVFFRHTDFEAANDARVTAGLSPYVNPRNGAAGALRASSGPPVQLSFAAYATVGDVFGSDTHAARMATVQEWGFDTARRLTGGHLGNAGLDDVATEIERINGLRPELGFDVDGAVVKVDSDAVAAAAGVADRAPRWAVAYKWPAPQRLTRLVNIEVQVGRTGVVTPVAVLDPVEVSGATVTQATLHNPSEVARKDLRPGDMVMVRRAGEVIPEVVARHGPHPEGSKPWVPPQACPRCGGDLDRSQLRWRCPQRECGLPEQLDRFVSRDAMDIEGLGPSLIRRLVNAGWLRSVADLYRLDVNTLASMERVGPVSAAKLVQGIAASKRQPLSRVLTGLGVRTSGRRLSARLAARFPTLPVLLAARSDDLVAVEGVGPVRAEIICSDLEELADVCGDLVSLGVGTAAVAPAAGTADGSLSGKKVMITGSVPGMSRREATEAAEAAGATVSSSVSSSTDLVVAGPGAGSKLTRARELGVPVISGEEFAAIVNRPHPNS